MAMRGRHWATSKPAALLACFSTVQGRGCNNLGRGQRRMVAHIAGGWWREHRVTGEAHALGSQRADGVRPQGITLQGAGGVSRVSKG